MLKKFPSDKRKVTKNTLFFLSRLCFCLTEIIDVLTLKRHNLFQNKNNRKATHSFAPTPQILKFKQDV